MRMVSLVAIVIVPGSQSVSARAAFAIIRSEPHRRREMFFIKIIKLEF